MPSLWLPYIERKHGTNDRLGKTNASCQGCLICWLTSLTILPPPSGPPRPCRGLPESRLVILQVVIIFHITRIHKCHQSNGYQCRSDFMPCYSPKTTNPHSYFHRNQIRIQVKFPAPATAHGRRIVLQQLTIRRSIETS